MNNREAIIELAASYVGCVEGDMRHKQIIDRYNGKAPLPRGYAVKVPDPWCAAFVSSCALQILGDKVDTLFGVRECSCGEMMRLADVRGIWHDKKYVPQPGDLILFDWDEDGAPNHVGFVQNVQNGVIKTIEGNKNHRCDTRKIATDDVQIRGYISPIYDEPETHWYDEAMERAKSAGLMDGTRPDEPLTRAEMATILCRIGEC